jgi:hypothetical protein
MGRHLLILCGLASCAPVEEQNVSDFGTTKQPLVAVDKSLTISWQGQQTGYWCGPGSTRMALTARMANPPSQTTLANFMGTTVNGTNHIGLVADALNTHLGTNVYVTRNISDPPGPGQQTALQNTIVGSISNGYAMVGNVISGWRPPGYPSGTIYHYVAIVGYQQGGARVQIADPAGACSAGSYWCNVPQTYWISISDLAIWIGGKGYTGTDLAPKDEAPVVTTGTLTGMMYQNGNTSNRVEGVTVKVGTQTFTTGADGLYTATIPAGVYTVTASKNGYTSASVMRTVTNGNTVWGSIELVAQATTGILTGKIFATQMQNPTDMSQLVQGALVKVGTQMSTTGANGEYRFTLPPGNHVVQVSKSGFVDSSLTRTVAVGATVQGDIGLSTAMMPDTQAPEISLSFASDGNRVLNSVLQLSGTASDNRTAIGSVQISLNGAAVQTVPVTSNTFSTELMLKAGDNTLVVSAIDGAGLEGRIERTILFATGFSGAVRNAKGDAVSGASVVMRDGTGAALRNTITNANGAFEFDVIALPEQSLIEVKAMGYRTARQSVTLSLGTRETINVELVQGVDDKMTTQGPGTPTVMGSCGCSGIDASLFWLALMPLVFRLRRSGR